jgi:hypothetical protein
MSRGLVYTEEEYAQLLARMGRLQTAALEAVTPTLPGRALGADAPEGVLQGRLQQLCQDLGLLYHHHHNAKRSSPGWPDVACVAPAGGVLHLWELKSADGHVSPAQRRWLDALERVTEVQVAVYRPGDWETMRAILLRRGHHG